ncbi:membrane protein [Streptomyces phage Emma1919]|nr:membrane protein [Streptomyces phage Emma1919]
MWFLIPPAYLLLGIAGGSWVNLSFWSGLLTLCVVGWVKSS